MKILVVQTNTYRYLDPTPLGASLVAMRLEQDGHRVRFVDLMRERDPIATAAREAACFRPDLTCFSVRNRDNMSPSNYLDPMPEISRIVQAVRRAWGAPTLLGGTAFTTFPGRIFLALEAEWGIAGDDLEQVSRFVASLAGGSPDLETPGLVYRDQTGRVVENPFHIVGYRDLVFDSYRFIDLRRYRKGYWQAAVVTRSGCPEHCAYCDSFHTFGSSFVLREPVAIAEELLALKRGGEVRSVFLVDAGFNRPLDHAKETLREILRRGAQLQLSSVFDPGEADREFFELFRRAGGIMVVLFAESLSDPVLAALGKPFTTADVERDVAELRRAGIGFGFMPTFGSPGETRETVHETLRRTPGLKATFCELLIGWRIQPRTPLRERAVREGLLEADDDCYAPRFYVSPETPREWLELQLRRYRRRHPLARLRVVPFALRMAMDRPWRRGPDPLGA